jgi:hypothetical protein
MSHLPVSGEQPAVPRLDPAALARFEADWTAVRVQHFELPDPAG